MSTATKPPTTPPAQATPGGRAAQTDAAKPSGTQGFVEQSNVSGGLVERSPLASLTPAEALERRRQQNELQARNESEWRNSAAYARYLARRRETVTLGCRPLSQVYPGTPNLTKTIGSRPIDAAWVCGQDRYLKFTERTNWPVQYNEFRVFIEGAEVTSYLEGSLSWTIESTGGMNTCRFTLNNSQDAFIVTPLNVCAGPENTRAWRLFDRVRGGSGARTINTRMQRRNWRVDEVVKWQIYKKKYDIVMASGGDTMQIDSDTGMWLYPLNPYSCIFNRHDVIRCFAKIPHIGNVTIDVQGTKIQQDFWIPVFTGFIRDYSWNDDPVEGKRSVNITAYDYRGLMERMRVRIYAGRAGGGDAKGAPGTQRDAPPGTFDRNTNVADQFPWLKCAVDKGNEWEKRLTTSHPGAITLYNRIPNPYNYADSKFGFFQTFSDMRALRVYAFMKGGSTDTTKACAGDKPLNIGTGGVARIGTDYDGDCAKSAVEATASEVSDAACNYINTLGFIMGQLALIYDLTGEVNVPVRETTRPALPPSAQVRTRSCKLHTVVGTDLHSTTALNKSLDHTSSQYRSRKAELVNKAMEAYTASETYKNISTEVGNDPSRVISDLGRASRLSIEQNKARQALTNALAEINAIETEIRDRVAMYDKTLMTAAPIDIPGTYSQVLRYDPTDTYEAKVLKYLTTVFGPLPSLAEIPIGKYLKQVGGVNVWDFRYEPGTTKRFLPNPRAALQNDPEFRPQTGLEMDPARFRDYASGGRLWGRMRPWSRIHGVMLHSTSGELTAPEEPPTTEPNFATFAALDHRFRRLFRMNYHILVTKTGQLVFTYPWDQTIWHGHIPSLHTIGIGFLGNPWGAMPGTPGFTKGVSYGRVTARGLTEPQVKAAMVLLNILEKEFKEKQQKWTLILSHRQSSSEREADPGEDCWKRVAVPWMAQLNAGKALADRALPTPVDQRTGTNADYEGTLWYSRNSQGQWRLGLPISNNWDSNSRYAYRTYPPGVKTEPFLLKPSPDSVPPVV